MRYILFWPVLGFFILAACQKESSTKFSHTDYSEPLVYTTAIGDSLPSQLIEKFHLQNTQGVSIDYQPHIRTCYFSYQADHQALLREVTLIPFSIYAKQASTLCLPTTHAHLKELRQSISTTEFENSKSFWNADIMHAEIFECIKGSFRHTLILQPGNKVLHRIEEVG